MFNLAFKVNLKNPSIGISLPPVLIDRLLDPVFVITNKGVTPSLFAYKVTGPAKVSMLKFKDVLVVVSVAAPPVVPYRPVKLTLIISVISLSEWKAVW
jgi:hypothetical protein